MEEGQPPQYDTQMHLFVDRARGCWAVAWASAGECVSSAHSGCGMIEKGVSIQQSGGLERPGNFRSATKAQRKLAPRRKVGMPAVGPCGGWLDSDLARQRIYSARDIFLLLGKAFLAGGDGGGPVCFFLHYMLALSAHHRHCAESGWTLCFHTALPPGACAELWIWPWLRPL